MEITQRPVCLFEIKSLPVPYFAEDEEWEGYTTEERADHELCWRNNRLKESRMEHGGVPGLLGECWGEDYICVVLEASGKAGVVWHVANPIKRGSGRQYGIFDLPTLALRH